MGFKLFKKAIYFFLILLYSNSCSHAPAINETYDFSIVKTIKIDKISDYPKRPGSGQIMEDNLSFIFMKNGFNVSQLNNNTTVINLNDKGEKNLSLSCTLTEYTDRETILIPYRVEDRGSIETIITQSSESNGDDQNAIATTSTTTTTDGGSIQESRKLEYTQARVGIILKLKDEETGLLVWTHSYWYSGIELPSTAQVCARNSVGLISKLFNN